jgi:hypothetical protein
MVEIREVVAALEAAIADQRGNLGTDDESYELGYLDGLERAANIVVIKAAGLRTGLEAEQTCRT